MDKKYSAQIKQFGEKVKELRLKKNLTQVELAKECKVDIRTIQRIENSKYAIGLEIIFRLAEIFEVPPYKLLKDIEISKTK